MHLSPDELSTILVSLRAISSNALGLSDPSPGGRTLDPDQIDRLCQRLAGGCASIAAHSPGPWTLRLKPAGIASIYDNDNRPIAGIAFFEDDPIEIHQANAHLIKAAPQLLKALRRAERAIQDVRTAYPDLLEALSADHDEISDALALAEPSR